MLKVWIAGAGGQIGRALNDVLDPMQIEALNKSMGLDKPALVRYVDWIAGLFRGDLGVSYRYQQPVAQLISDALEVTGSLAIITLILTLIIGVLAGVWLADHR